MSKQTEHIVDENVSFLFAECCFPLTILPLRFGVVALYPQTASHHLDGGSILNLVINSLEEVIMNYVPHEMPPLVDSI